MTAFNEEYKANKSKLSINSARDRKKSEGYGEKQKEWIGTKYAVALKRKILCCLRFSVQSFISELEAVMLNVYKKKAALC